MGKILVVDDEQNWLDLMREGLESEGHEVLTAGSGLTVFEILESTPLDLLVLDIQMPLNGRSILWFVESYQPDLPVILHSAYGGFRGNPDFKWAKAFAVKSPDLAELKRAVRDVLGESPGSRDHAD
ncbi:MAG: response regulator [Planctomycetota bacterium]